MRLTRELDMDTEARLKKAVFVGRLANEDELAYSFIDAAVKLQEESDNHLLFHLQCLSDIPDELSQHFYYHNRIFRGTTRSMNNVQKIRGQLVPQFDRLQPQLRRNRLEESLAGKVILFSLYCNGHNLFLDIIKIEQAQPLAGYRGIPGPRRELNVRSVPFEERLQKRLPIVLAHYPSLFPNPDFIYYDRVLYGNLKLDVSANNPTTYYLQNPDEVRCMDVPAWFFEQVRIRYDDHMFIVSLDSLQELKELYERGSYPLQEAIRRRNEARQAEESAKLKPALRLVGQQPERREAEAQIAGAAEAVATGTRVSEAHFLAQLEENARFKGLYFDRLDLVNFHLSLKTNLLTIVGGMSGTGKSQLALLYGETLGLQYNKHLCLIPVSPSYHEPSDVLGFMNPTTGMYQESETGLVRTLLEAERCPDQMYMIVFDEMNLAQVEHWFSPFISILELERDKRQLRLYNPELSCRNGYKPEIAIGDNVLFVGTVNFDETTKAFSNRLLDRANVITPRKLSFADVWRMQAQASPGTPVSLQVPKGQYRDEWTHKARKIAALTEAEIDLLDRAHQTLEQEDRQQGISFRVVQAIAYYLENIPGDADGQPLITRQDALDIQFKQRVLSKISGMESVIGPLVGSYDGDDYQEGLLAKVLQSAPHVSSFTRSIDLLKNKAKELMVHGFAY